MAFSDWFISYFFAIIFPFIAIDILTIITTHIIIHIVFSFIVIAAAAAAFVALIIIPCLFFFSLSQFHAFAFLNLPFSRYRFLFFQPRFFAALIFFLPLAAAVLTYVICFQQQVFNTLFFVILITLSCWLICLFLFRVQLWFSKDSKIPFGTPDTIVSVYLFIFWFDCSLLIFIILGPQF